MTASLIAGWSQMVNDLILIVAAFVVGSPIALFWWICGKIK